MDINSNGKKVLLEAKEVVKVFPGVIALDKVNFKIMEGEVHCLAGENGAGKSTLIEIIGGTQKKDSGKILLEGKEVDFDNPRDAQENGIAVLHQELPLLPYLSVAENIYLARQPLNKLKLISYHKMIEMSKKILEIIGADINPKEMVGKLPVAKQQLVSIAKALSLQSKIIIFDEPSAVLTIFELKKLFKIIRSLKNEGRGIVYISHRLEEVFEIGDRVTVLRNGKLIGTKFIREVTKDELINMMIGKKIKEVYRKSGRKLLDKKPKLRIINFSRQKIFQNINFDLYEGETLGVFGLVGSGRTELARSIIGADKLDSGEIFIDEKKLLINSPKDAIKYGICLIPEDRKKEGLFLNKSVKFNIVLPNLRRLKNLLTVDYKKISNYALTLTKKLNIVTPSINQLVKFLSGGNQQKIVLAKWLGINTQIIIFDEPTRGIDVGAKEEIRNLINGLAKEGKSIIFISSELPEILKMSDRIAVMHNGTLVKIYKNYEATEENILACAMGVK